MSTATLNTILHIDDDDDIRSIAAMSLETLGGFDVISCNGYESAREALKNNKPDFIIIDVMMPNIDGPETLKRLREEDLTSDAPVAFMTAKIMESELQRLEQLNINGIIKKPFDPSTICDEIREIVESTKDF